VCETIDLERQDRVLAASRWTNVMLQPPTEALGMLIGAMSQNPALANVDLHGRVSPLSPGECCPAATSARARPV
jgi:hypothetical protein